MLYRSCPIATQGEIGQIRVSLTHASSRSSSELIGKHVPWLLYAYGVPTNDHSLKVCYTWTCAMPNSFDLTMCPRLGACLQTIPLSKSISVVVENSHSATGQRRSIMTVQHAEQS